MHIHGYRKSAYVNRPAAAWSPNLSFPVGRPLQPLLIMYRSTSALGANLQTRPRCRSMDPAIKCYKWVKETSSPKFLHPAALGLDTVIPRNRNQQMEIHASKPKSAQPTTQQANYHAKQLNPNHGTNGTNPAARGQPRKLSSGVTSF